MKLQKSLEKPGPLFDIQYSQLFWGALKLTNWSKNVIGEYMCAAHDPVAHYCTRDYVSSPSRIRVRVFGGINLCDLVKKITNSPN